MSVGRAGPGQADGRSSSFTTYSLPLAGAETGKRIAVISVNDVTDDFTHIISSSQAGPVPAGITANIVVFFELRPAAISFRHSTPIFRSHSVTLSLSSCPFLRSLSQEKPVMVHRQLRSLHY